VRALRAPSAFHSLSFSKIRALSRWGVIRVYRPSAHRRSGSHCPPRPLFWGDSSNIAGTPVIRRSSLGKGGFRDVGEGLTAPTIAASSEGGRLTTGSFDTVRPAKSRCFAILPWPTAAAISHERQPIERAPGCAGCKPQDAERNAHLSCERVSAIDDNCHPFMPHRSVRSSRRGSNRASRC